MTVMDSNSPNNNTVVMTADDSTAISPLNFFTAETLLGDSPFMGPVLKLRDSISRSSDGTIVDYDAVVSRIKDEVDALPTLELQQDIPSGAEGTYQRQLLHALEKINDDHDRVSRKLLKIKSRLVNAITLMKNQRSQFVAYYSLAYPAAVRNSNGVGQKLSVKGIENLASGEYSRIMDNLDSAAVSLISEITILEMEIKSRKAASAAKYQLGKDQVNLIWNSFQSQGAIGLDDDPGALLKKFPVEEDDEEVPSFVSRHTKEVRVGASIIKPSNTNTGVPTGTFCSVCMKPQFSTPGGDTCPNGHGGADPYDEDENEFRTQGTFYKRGDPKPITPIIDDGPKTINVVPDTTPMVTTLHVGVDEERADPDYSVTIEADATWTEVDEPEVMHEATGTIKSKPQLKMPEWSKERLMELAEDEPGGLMACSPEIYADIKAQNEAIVVIEPDAEGLAAIGELARKMNAETMAEIEASRLAKMKVLVAPPISAEELLNLRAHIDECKDDFSGQPLVVDYTAKWDNLQPTTTKPILIEDIDIADSAPHSMQEATKLMEDATLGELDLPDFQPITSKVLTGFTPLYVAPDKVVAADDFESIMNAEEPLATQAPTTQRKKLSILEEDEL